MNIVHHLRCPVGSKAPLGKILGSNETSSQAVELVCPYCTQRARVNDQLFEGPVVHRYEMSGRLLSSQLVLSS